MHLLYASYYERWNSDKQDKRGPIFEQCFVTAFLISSEIRKGSKHFNCNSKKLSKIRNKTPCFQSYLVQEKVIWEVYGSHYSLEILKYESSVLDDMETTESTV